MAEPGHTKLNKCKKDGEPTQKGTEQKDDGNIDRCPRGIEKGNHAVSRKKLANIGQISKCLGHIVPGTVQIGFKTGIEDKRIERFIKPDACPYQKARTQPLGKSHHRIKKEQKKGNHKERQLTAALHHTAINLEHVDCRGQHQHVGNHAENANPQKFPSKLPELTGQGTTIEKIWFHKFKKSLLVSWNQPLGLGFGGGWAAGGDCSASITSWQVPKRCT